MVYLEIGGYDGTAQTLIQTVGQHLQGDAGHWAYRRSQKRSGTFQESLHDWLAALAREFAVFKCKALLRAKFQDLVQDSDPMENCVARFRQQQDKVAATGMQIPDDAARDQFVTGLSAQHMKVELTGSYACTFQT